MNAPPGVDTDTSGEDFTPPPTPPPDRTRPQFSLTSLLTATPRPREAQRKAAEVIKQQTPIEAADDPPKQKTPTTRLKKKVRIAEDKKADQPIEAAPAEESAIIPRKVEELDQHPTSDSSRDIIELLNRLLTQNDDTSAEDADSELSSASSDSRSDDASPIGLEVAGITEQPPAVLPKQPVPSPTSRHRLREQTRLKLLPSWLRPKKLVGTSLISSPGYQPTPIPLSPASAPANEIRPSKTSAAVGQNTPWTALLPSPQSHGSPYTTNPSQPFTDHTAAATEHSPFSPNSKVWAGNYPNNVSTYNTQQVGTSAAWEGMPNPPPWLWTGQNTAMPLSGQAPVLPSPSQGHPYPPIYPHPASLQPWNPWYPQQYATGRTSSANPYVNPYDGIQEQEEIPSESEGIPLPSNPKYPSRSSERQCGPGTLNSGDNKVLERGSRHEPRSRDLPNSPKTPELVDAASLVSSVYPVVETAHARHTRAEPVDRAKVKGRSHGIAVSQEHGHTASTRKERETKAVPRGPTEDVREAGTSLGSSSSTPPSRKPKSSEGSNSASRVHKSSLVAAAALAVPGRLRDNRAEADRGSGQTDHDGHPTSPVAGSGRAGSSGTLPGQRDVGNRPASGARTLANPSWSECLLSMAVCINLMHTIIDKTRKGQSGETKTCKEVVISSLSRIAASLVAQRSLAEALRATLDKEHGPAIDTFAKELRILANFVRRKAAGSGFSAKDMDQLSRLHKHTSESLKSAGATLLLSHLAELSFLATPKIISAILELGSDWYEGELSGKKVIQTALLIRHEVEKGRSDETKDKHRDEDGKIRTPGSALTEGIKLLCKIFASDEELEGEPFSKSRNRASIKDSPPKVSPHRDREHHSRRGSEDVESRRKEHRHRSPMTVLLDLVHSKSDTNESAQKPAIARSLKRSQITGDDPIERSTKTRAARKDPPSGSCQPPKAMTTPRSPLILSSFPRNSEMRKKVIDSEEENIIPELMRDVVTHSDSSPSIYSQNDIDSEGTVESDEEARELLAQADSGPPRRSINQTEHKDIDEKPTHEQVARAKKVVFGDKGSQKASHK